MRLVHTLVLPLLFALPAVADVLVVGNGPGADHATISDAVAAAAAGDIVLVRPGTYTESVLILGMGLTLVADGPVVINGRISVANLPSPSPSSANDSVVLLSGFDVRLPQQASSTPLAAPLELRACNGPVRVQDCRFQGADSSFSFPGTWWPWHGGPGVIAEGCADVAWIDTDIRGGGGGVAVVAPGGHGGNGANLMNVGRASFIRSVVIGGRGGGVDDPGNGGHGLVATGKGTVHSAYSFFQGGEPGCRDPLSFGTPGWFYVGGDGARIHCSGGIYEFASLFEGGGLWTGCDPSLQSGNNSPGAPLVGGPVRSMNGFPNTLHAPAIVREGEAWSVEIVAGAGETAQLFHGSGTTFDFDFAREQPRFIGGANVRRFPNLSTVPANNRVVLQMPVLSFPATVDGFVHGFQGFITDSSGVGAFTSPRFVVVLDDGL